jgi:hypothetical protein
MKRLAFTKRRILVVILCFAGMFILYLLILCFPDPLFAYEFEHGPIVIRSDLPIPATAEMVLRESERRQPSGTLGKRLRLDRDRARVAGGARAAVALNDSPSWLHWRFRRVCLNLGPAGSHPFKPK